MNTITLLAITIIIIIIVIIILRVNGLLRRRQTEPFHSKCSHSVFDCGEGCFEVVVMMAKMMMMVMMMVMVMTMMMVMMTMMVMVNHHWC